MIQSRIASLIEALSNVVAGYGLAVALQALLFPAFGLHQTLGQSLKLGVWFTLLSVLRSYVIRRVFERLRPGRP
jgi:hypothetical protein